MAAFVTPGTRQGLTRRGALTVSTGTLGAPLLAAACGLPGGGPGTASAPGEVSGELTWAAPGPTVSDEQKQVADDFKARYPKIRVSYNPSADAIVFYAYLVSSTAAGTPPDVISLHTFVVPEQVERGV